MTLLLFLMIKVQARGVGEEDCLRGGIDFDMGGGEQGRKGLGIRHSEDNPTPDAGFDAPRIFSLGQTFQFLHILVEAGSSRLLRSLRVFPFLEHLVTRTGM